MLSFKYWCGSITSEDCVSLLNCFITEKRCVFASCMLVIYGYGYSEVLVMLKVLQFTYKARCRCLLKNPVTVYVGQLSNFQ